MKAATVHELKAELSALPAKQLVELCSRLARFKTENKELLTYLLFEAHDEPGFVNGVKVEIDELFAGINSSQLYFAKKSLRKIARIISKYCRYSANKETELQLRIYFCQCLKDSDIPVKKNTVIHNLYLAQLKKTGTLIAALHEDLQYEYQREVDALGNI